MPTPLPDLFTVTDLPGSSAPQRAGASAIIRQVAQWHIAPSITETITLTGNGDSSMSLSTLKATGAVVKVGGVVTAYASVLPMGQLIFADGYGPSVGATITVDLTHGYDTCPAALLTVARGLLARDASAGNVVKAEGLGGWTTQYVAAAAAFTPLEALLVAPYILPWLS